MEEPEACRPRTRPALGAAALLLIALFLVSLDAQAADAPLVINGDAALAAAAHSGAGTLDNPYRIRGLVVSAALGHGIQITGTRAHLVLDGVAVASGGGAYDGIRLVDVQNVTIVDSTLEGDRIGIHVQDARDVTIERTTVKSSRVGVSLERATSVHLLDNRLSVNDKDVSLRDARDNRFLRNNLTTATGQFGFFFEDALSYRNEIGTTNVANFLPVHWYVHPCPARIEGIAMELKGVTNVAQVMLHGCRETVVDGVRAKDGVRDGIHLLDAWNVTLSRLTVEGNAGPGVHVEGGHGARVETGTLRANGVGVRLERHPNASLADLTLESNLAEGVRATTSADLTLTRVKALQNGGRGLALEATPRVRIFDGNATENRAAGISLEDSPNATISRNRLASNLGPGVFLLRSQAWADDNVLYGQPQQVRFSATSGSDFRGNALTIAPAEVGFHFDDTFSYANTLDVTNAVNGVPVRWYHAAAGAPGAPVRISAFNVSVPGATNVAQVMVHRSRHVELDGFTASDGLAHGLLVYGSSNVTVTGLTAERNGRSGVRVEGGADVRVQGSDARDNREDGFAFSGSTAPTLENVRSQRNLARGAYLEDAPLATVRGLAATANRAAGLHLVRGAAEPALLENNVVQGNLAGGILLHDARASLVRGNVVADNGPDGIHLLTVREGAVLLQNEVRNHTRGIHLANTKGVQIQENRLAIEAQQHGLFFADEVSWNNSIPTTNTVNGVAVRWYNEDPRAAAAPLVLTGVRVELPGITNVAQILLRRVENVTLDNAVLANGTHRGLVLLESANVAVSSGRIEGNALDGVQARQSEDLLIQGTMVASNRGHGVHLVQGARTHLEGALLHNNLVQGLRAEATGVTLAHVSASGNGDAGLAFVGDHPDGVLVANASLVANRGGGLRAEGVRLHALHNSTIQSNVGLGALVAGGTFGLIQDSRWTNNTGGGLRIEGAAPGLVLRNALHDNGDAGIHLVSARAGGNVSDNLLVNHTRGLAFAGTVGWQGHGNRVHLRLGGQTGFHFADEVSYDNTLPTTNAVNGTPLRWYANVVGPRTVEGIQAEVKGMTNVAQVVVANSRDLVLVAPIASNGTGHGVLLHRSTNVTIQGGLVAGNAKDGVHVFEGSQHTVRNATVRSSGEDGVRLWNANANVVAGSELRDNLGAGLRSIGRTSGNEVSDARVRGNVRAGIELEDAIAPRVLRSQIEQNGATGIRLLRISGIARVEDNVLANHTAGLRIAGTEYAEVHRNALTLTLAGQIGFHFDDEVSYNNVLPPTNTVNGTALRWYVGLTGTESNPIVLRDLAVELRGITNVAQVMLYRSSYVTLDGVRANEGVARGVELYHSSSIILLNVTARGNEDGIQLKSTQSSQLRAPQVGGNARGVKLVASGSNLLQDVNASRTEVGILFADAASLSNRVSGTEANLVRTASVQDPTASGLRGNNLLVDAGLDKRVRVDRPLRFDGGLATYRFETERIVLQRWEYGDRTQDESREAAPFRPLHTYTAPGFYRVALTIQTADGALLRDEAWVTVVPPLSAPLNPRAVEGDRNVTLLWDAPASDGASPITAHRVYRGATSDNLTLLGEFGPVQTALDTKELTNGKTYFYAIAAVNADGEGPRSLLVQASPGTTPSVPRNLLARAGNANVTLRWDAPADDGGRALTGYRVFRGPTAYDLVAFADLGNVTAWTDPAVLNGFPYSYAVAALNAKGVGVRTTPVAGTPSPLPSPPSSLHALPTERSVTLVWEQPLRPAEGAVLKWRVLRGDSVANLTFLAESDSKEYRDATALQGVLLHYAVVAVNDAGESDRSAVVTARLQEGDALKPIFLATGPDPSIVHVGHPGDVFADYLDNLGVVPATVRVEVDGVDVTASATITARAARYAPPQPFAPGSHAVRITVADAAGNVALAEWTFRVLDPAAAQPRWHHEGLNLTSQQVLVGESVLVQSLVRNVGGVPGTLEVELVADGAVVASKPVTLEPGQEETVAFRFKPTLPGPVNLTVGNQTPLLLNVILESDASALEGVTLPLPDGVPEGAAPLEPEEEDEGKLDVGAAKSFLPGPSVGVALAVGGLAALLMRRRRDGR